MIDFGDEYTAGDNLFFCIFGLSLLTVIMHKLYSKEGRQEKQN